MDEEKLFREMFPDVEYIREEETKPSQPQSAPLQEPTLDKIREAMEETGSNDFYNTRERLRDKTYSRTYEKAPHQSWGDFWKSY